MKNQEKREEKIEYHSGFLSPEKADELESEITKLKKDLETQEYAYSRLNQENQGLHQKHNSLLQTNRDLITGNDEINSKLESQKFLNKQLLTSNSNLNNEIQDKESIILSSKQMLRIEVSEREKKITELNALLIRFQDLDKSHTFWKALAISSITLFGITLTLLLTKLFN